MMARRASQDHFYDAFIRHAKCTLDAASAVRGVLEEPWRATELAPAIAETEHAGNAITRGVMMHLHETWLTPFDRTDILELVTRMDEVLDLTETVSERFVLFDLSTTRPHAVALADMLVESCAYVLRGVELLPLKKSEDARLELCVKIRTLEEAADVVHRRALASLFGSRAPTETNDRLGPLDILKWREIYDTLEGATDGCAAVANVLEGLALASR
jgi:predicted phosphate transport protein (TIGR00153 family)